MNECSSFNFSHFCSTSIEIVGSSTDADVYNFRGHILFALGRFTEGITDCNKVVEVDGDNIRALYQRGLCREKLGEHVQAIEDFTSCIRLDGSNAAAYFSRGCAQDSLGFYNKALQDYTKAIALDPEIEKKIL